MRKKAQNIAVKTEEQLLLEEKRAKFVPDEGHSKPITRRELLAAGLANGFATLCLPSAMSLFAREAHAQTTGKIANPPAYLEIHAAGGAALMAQVAMKAANRDFLSSYDLVGLGSRTYVQGLVEELFANKAPFITTSGLYKGLKNTLASNLDIFSKSAFITMASESGSDTVSNPLSASGLVQLAVAQGAYLPNIRTTRVINNPAVIQPPAPVVVEQFSNLLDVLQPRATDTMSTLPAASQQTITEMLGALNDKQIARYLGWNQGDVLKSSSQNAIATILNLQKNRASLSVDPAKNASFSTIWNLAATSGASYKRDYLEAGVVYNLAQGHATSGGILRPGYDYHKSDAKETNRIATDAADEELGVLIARVLLSFKVMNKPVFIYLTSDGSCTAKEVGTNKYVWVSDSNIMAANMIIAYHPTKGVGVSKIAGQAASDYQIGHFHAGQAADKTHLVGDARGSALGAFVNYLNFCGVDGATYAKKLTGKSGEILIDGSTDLAALSRILPG